MLTLPVASTLALSESQPAALTATAAVPTPGMLMIRYQPVTGEKHQQETCAQCETHVDLRRLLPSLSVRTVGTPVWPASPPSSLSPPHSSAYSSIMTMLGLFASPSTTSPGPGLAATALLTAPSFVGICASTESNVEAALLGGGTAPAAPR
eukprot:3289973-Rhodomonas_salina.2